MTKTFFAGFRDYWATVGRAFSTILRATAVAVTYLSSRNDRNKEVTEQYPDPVSSRMPDELPPRTRGLLANDIGRCTGCGDCIVICPTACIQMDVLDGPKAGKKWVGTFNIDHGKCLFCGLCTEVCQPQSLRHSRNYESATPNAEEQVRSFGRGQVSAATIQRWSELRAEEGGRE